MRYLKQNVNVHITVGPALAIADGITPVENLTPANVAGYIIHDHDDGTDTAHTAFACVATADADYEFVTIHAGYYDLDIPQAQTNLVGRMIIGLYDTDVCLPFWHEFMVLPALVYDSLMGTDNLQVDAIQVGGTTQTANDMSGDVNEILIDTAVIGALGAGLTAIPYNAAWDADIQSECTDALNAYDPPTKTELDTAQGAVVVAANGITATSIVADAINAAAIKAYAVTKIQTGLATPTNITAGTITTATNVTTVNGLANNVITAASIAAGAIDNATFAADVGSTAYATNIIALAADKAIVNAALSTQASVNTIDGIVDDILVDTAVIGALGAGLTAIPWNANWDTEVQSECDDAITANADIDAILIDTGTTLDGKLNTIAGYIDTEVGAIKGVTDKLDTAMELDGAVYRYTTNALEMAPGGGGLTLDQIADAVWDEAKAGHVGATTFGDLPADIDAVKTKTDLISTDIVSANPNYMHNPLVDQADMVVAQVGLIRNKPSAAAIQIAEITTAGLIKVWRYRKGTDAGWTIIVNGDGMGKAIGGVYYTYAFPAASWADGDLILYEVYNTVVTLGVEVFTLSTVQGFGVIGDTTQTAAIKTILDKLDSAMAADGAVYQFTENALELIRCTKCGLKIQKTTI